ncbi:hypothetical protein BU23DRAFT_569187 [Bimuria novae-zelandiae CBS 107.79]|uniref:Uncharacterized protein n=1 Tax=Bimuria novae-zelandiae CBS 107.79 TaxID=1447943 RepID=A0A6A5V8P5_9PLEO|nr:hypothetical protein BU23DRAFT_569187 [Bimuria novae-zelandiae CBS 107.79]
MSNERRSAKLTASSHDTAKQSHEHLPIKTSSSLCKDTPPPPPPPPPPSPPPPPPPPTTTTTTTVFSSTREITEINASFELPLHSPSSRSSSVEVNLSDSESDEGEAKGGKE